jgi:Domain of unknown function (DUF4864)
MEVTVAAVQMACGWNREETGLVRLLAKISSRGAGTLRRARSVVMGFDAAAASCRPQACMLGLGSPTRGDSMRATGLALTLLLMALPSWAADLLTPDPALSPEQVVTIQLSALQANEAGTDAGIALTWAFAHPDNKRMTGPLSRFAQMIRGPQYRMLLNHRAHDIRSVSRTDDEAVFAVTVTSQAGEVVGYRWSVAKVIGGEHAGAWMTIAVSSPVSVGQAI